MITLNKLIKTLHAMHLQSGNINDRTSPRAMSIKVSQRWRRFDSCPVAAPPKHLTEDFVVNQHLEDACTTYEHQFSEREELAADIIIDAAMALAQQGCRNIEQLVKDRIAWRLEHKG